MLLRKKMCSIIVIIHSFFSEVHFQLSDDVYKKVLDKNSPRKLLIQKNYPLEVIKKRERNKIINFVL
jgi:hypothetical protein